MYPSKPPPIAPAVAPPAAFAVTRCPSIAAAGFAPRRRPRFGGCHLFLDGEGVVGVQRIRNRLAYGISEGLCLSFLSYPTSSRELRQRPLSAAGESALSPLEHLSRPPTHPTKTLRRLRVAAPSRSTSLLALSSHQVPEAKLFRVAHRHFESTIAIAERSPSISQPVPQEPTAR